MPLNSGDGQPSRISRPERATEVANVTPEPPMNRREL